MGTGLQEVVLANHGDESGRPGVAHHLESYIYWGICERIRRFAAHVDSDYQRRRRGDGRPSTAMDFPTWRFVNYNSQEQSVYVYWGDGKAASANRGGKYYADPNSVCLQPGKPRSGGATA